MKTLVLATCVFVLGLTSGCGSASEDAASSSAAESVEAAAPIKNFHTVRPGAVYRGAAPGDKGLGYLKQLGIRTIVDLRIGDYIEESPDDILHEKSQAAKLGMAWIHQEMSAFEFPSDAKMNAILDLLADSSKYPIFIHCTHGEDRTGLAIGLERVLQEGWQPQAAHDEMIKYGFHTFFEGLNHYFEERTGWED